MTENQKFRSDLLTRMGNDIEQAKRAYEFIMAEVNIPVAETTPTSATQAGYGVYLVYEDGHSELFNGTNKKEGAISVAFKNGPVSLKLYYEDIEVSMECEDDEDRYIETYDDAVADFDGIGNTKSLLSRGWDANFEEGFFCPSLGQLYYMYPLKKELNNALEYIGAKPIENRWYWSSSEYSAPGAWGLGFSSGSFSGSLKVYERRVRPVSAFV